MGTVLDLVRPCVSGVGKGRVYVRTYVRKLMDGRTDVHVYIQSYTEHVHVQVVL